MKANKIPEEIVAICRRELAIPFTSVHHAPEGARPVIRDRDFTVATIAGRKAEAERRLKARLKYAAAAKKEGYTPSRAGGLV